MRRCTPFVHGGCSLLFLLVPFLCYLPVPTLAFGSHRFCPNWVGSAQLYGSNPLWLERENGYIAIVGGGDSRGRFAEHGNKSRLIVKIDCFEALRYEVEVEYMLKIRHHACLAAQYLKKRDPVHITDCKRFEAVVEHVGNGRHRRSLFTVMEMAPGRTLKSILANSQRSTAVELPDVGSVLKNLVRLFHVANSGINPPDESAVRYVFTDLNWGNVIIHADIVKVIDYDETLICIPVPMRGESQTVVERLVVPGCWTDTHARGVWRDALFMAVFNLFVNFVLMLIELPNDVSIHAAEVKRTCEDGKCPREHRWRCSFLPFGAKELCNDVHTARGTMKNSSLIRVAAKSIERQLKSVFRDDWYSFPIGAQLLVSGFAALRSLDGSWPPRFMKQLLDWLGA